MQKWMLVAYARGCEPILGISVFLFLFFQFCGLETFVIFPFFGNFSFEFTPQKGKKFN